MCVIAQSEEFLPTEWDYVPCPICHSENKKLYERFGHKYQYTYVFCLNCKNVYQSPRPRYDNNFLKAAYENYYLFDANHTYKESKYNDFNKELEEIIEFDKQRSSVLDIGCAMGDFLYPAKTYYAKTFGIELSDKMADYTSKNLGVTIFRTQFDSLQTNERFSCIHMSHIIEHVPNPNDWLAKAKQLLLPGGILVICVPNMFSMTRVFKLALKRLKIRKGRWKNPRRTPDHLFEPTVKGMEYLLTSNGFKIEKIYSYSRSQMTSKGIYSFFFHYLLKAGSNIRLYAKIAPH